MKNGYASWEEGDEGILPHKETLLLLEKAHQGDQEAVDILVTRNIALVKSIIKRFLNRGYDYDDLFQIGVIGLIKAIKNYDPQYNVRFSTYAVPMIMGEIKRFLRDDGIIKVSRSLKELANKSMAAKEQLKNILHREPSIQEIAEAVGCEPEEIIHALEASRTPSSIYDVVYEDDDNPILLIDKVSKEDTQMSQVVDRVALKDVLSKLSQRERYIIIMRYFHDKTQSDIANELGISQVQVSRIEKRVLLRMRDLI
ncbi:MAG: RNA polymerase sporulation sigma factor SigF [Clostridiales bacterium]|nr:RNA polymerase sporulation sigma factor SigF [Clostridiales bacterium]